MIYLSYKKIMKINIKIKRILAIFIITLMMFPLLQINVIASNYNKVTLYDIKKYKFDGNIPEDIEIVEYKDLNLKKDLSNSNLLGQNTLESKYDISTHINSGYQSMLDICWAFGNKNLLESYLSKKLNIKQNFSARHMDYALSNRVSNSINREPGTGSVPVFTFTYFTSNKGPVKEDNFPFNTAIESPTEETLNKNIENIYLEGFISYPSILKEITGNTTKYSVIKNHKLIKNVPETEVNQIRNLYKKHIKQYGALTAFGASKSERVEYPAEEFVYNTTDESFSYDHNLSIIGWDDNFCANNPDGSTSGSIPKSAGAWLVSDSNQPNGNQFYYVSYDDIFIEKLLLGFTDVSVGNRFNVYQHDLIGFNQGAIVPAMNQEGDPIIQIGNIYTKTDSDIEYLNKIGFYTTGNLTVDAYYVPKESVNNKNFKEKGTKVGTITVDNYDFEYTTIDINQSIQIPKGDFQIMLVIKDNKYNSENPRGVSILFEEKDLANNEYVNITHKNKSFVINNSEPLIIKNGNYPIRLYTSNKVLNTNTYLVSYDLQGGKGEFPSVNVTEGNYVVNTQIPTKEGYRFIGWEPNPETTPITKNTTFVAQWEKVINQNNKNDNINILLNKPDNTVTFVFGDGAIKYVEIGKDGYVKNIPILEPKEGYRFLGWNPDPKKVKANEDTVFYALWEKIGLNNSSTTNTEYTRGTKNDGTQANIKIPNAGKSVVIVFVILLIGSFGVVSFIKYKKIDI